MILSKSNVCPVSVWGAADNIGILMSELVSVLSGCMAVIGDGTPIDLKHFPLSIYDRLLFF